MDKDKTLQLRIRTLPDSPGIYQFYDETGVILYVGKAKNLKKRVSSYFNKESGLSGKTLMLVRRTADIRTIVVDTEYDALLLENSLIKEFQPRYNIMLKDDKTYPWICIRNEDFPRVFPTRTKLNDGSEYFGPYASVRNMNNLLEVVKQLYPVRTCKHKLSPANIRAGKFRVCLEYHIGNCLGPCEGKQSPEDYQEMVKGIREIIRGNIGQVVRKTKTEMQEFADQYEFEKAQQWKEKLELLEKYQSRSAVVSPSVGDAEVFTLLDEPQVAYVNFLKVNHGCVIQSYTLELKKKIEEDREEIMQMVVVELRASKISRSMELILPFDPGLEFPGVEIHVPQRGDKKKLLELSLRNALYYKAEKEKQKELADPERHSRRILEKMQTDLRLKELPEHIECFDNSNIQGDQAVAAMVVFRKARPAKADYRHFIIRSVEGPDDYASMEEVIRRRYTRLLAEKKPLPQLIIVDGGKGQLNAALEVLRDLGLYGRIGLIGIAKRLEEIYYPNDPLPMYLDKRSETLRVIQHIRDEAHRFGITHHRKRREKATIRTELTEIRGIGEIVAGKLLQHFKSVKRISKASLTELEEVIGKNKSVLVYNYFHAKKS
jgi:excinuclease ABC subunit C